MYLMGEKFPLFFEEPNIGGISLGSGFYPISFIYWALSGIGDMFISASKLFDFERFADLGKHLETGLFFLSFTILSS